ncbi:alpha-L-fucosidase [Brachybacterium alimentarium]|uniref:alpha-L-fucosidase n=1 Tax=Brachybacterium alimentarium TaxID=47845 RepID=UPI000DF1ABE2|nr:alpha-L-fucosidase [Brachybacterium alimentarium]RCS69701.1 alpha-L-fucosidase [Brachybacterium alimentarium]RCS89504.1 alpha-L-fucosidase [Brachybacterium alimentarium]
MHSTPRADALSTAPAVLAPTPAQLAWQKDGLGVFFHFGVNTFAGKEWSDGTLAPDTFDPSDLDADQWVRTARDLGAKYVVLTAKHHDGFCLWPTATTAYSVASSPWKDGGGDVVAEVVDACRRHGMKLGLYLSPWDRNAPQYEDPETYDEFYLAQLRELCTNYGELHELWFDGAGSAGREYAWDRIGDVIAELQPTAMVFNMGPATIRWVGNEDGLAADPVEYVTTSTDLNNYDEDVIETGEAVYLPPECDVSLRKGWFWQPGEEPKSLSHLLAIHDRSIGLGANLLLNIPPDRRGRLDDADVERVRELAEALQQRFGDPVEAVLETGGAGAVRAQLPAGTTFDHVEIHEALEEGQRVAAHRVLLEDGTVLATGGSIGVRRIHRLESPVQSDSLVVEVDGPGAVIESVAVHDAGDAPAPDSDIAYLASTEVPEM